MIKIWERVNKKGTTMYRCPMCRQLSWSDLAFCANCNSYMLTDSPKIRIDYHLKPLGPKKSTITLQRYNSCVERARLDQVKNKKRRGIKTDDNK